MISAAASRTTPDQLRAGIDLERLAHEQRPLLGLELGVLRAAALEERVELALDVSRVVPGSVRCSRPSTQRAG